MATESPTAISRIVHEPIGVCALIGPWNYPLLQIAWKVAPALAAGDTVVIKPAQVTPLTTIHLVRVLEEAGVPRGVVNLVLGPGGRVGQALAESLDVDMISLTGGTEAGRSIMAAAAGNVKRVALELGGKSPNIIFADADFETAVDNALTGAFVHSGQVCSAGCRVIVEAPIYDAFVAELGPAGGPDPPRAAVSTRRPRPARSSAPSTGPRSSGTWPSGSRTAPGSSPAAGVRTSRSSPGGFFYRPTVFADCDRRMRIVRDEIFGPVVTVERFTTEAEAIALGNDTSYGLVGRRLDAGRRSRPAGRRPAPPRDRLDQRLQRLPAAGRMGRLRAVRDRKGARPDGSRRVSRGEAHLPEHGARSRALVRRLMAGRRRYDDRPDRRPEPPASVRPRPPSARRPARLRPPAPARRSPSAACGRSSGRPSRRSSARPTRHLSNAEHPPEDRLERGRSATSPSTSGPARSSSSWASPAAASRPWSAA